jgi:ankyrin repeat protein
VDVHTVGFSFSSTERLLTEAIEEAKFAVERKLNSALIPRLFLSRACFQGKKVLMNSLSTADVIGQQQGAVFRRLCQQGNAQLVAEMLRNNSIAIDASQGDGCTGLWLAAEQGCAEVVKLLCGYHADINVTKNPGSVTPLYVAAQNGHEDVVAALLAAGANPNIAKSTGATPLYIACQQNFAGIARLLIRSGGSVSQANQQGISPLMIAAFQGNGECVKLLLEAGADPLQTGQGKNCLEWAQTNGHRRAIQNVLESHRARAQRDMMEMSNASAVPGTAAPQTPSSTPKRLAGGPSLFSSPAAENPSVQSQQPMTSSSWYTPSFLLRQEEHRSRSVLQPTAGQPPAGVGASPLMTPAAIAQYVAKKQKVVSAMTAGAAGFQSGGGITLAMLEEERRRNEEFRRAISKSITIGAKDDGESNSSDFMRGVGSLKVADEAAVFRVEQGWEAHKQHLMAHDAFLRESASEVSDSWMYSGQMIAQYQESINAKRQQLSRAQQRNIQLHEQNEQAKKRNPFLYPALSETKLSVLTEFMLKGASASGPPPPLPSEEEEEKMTQPDKYTAPTEDFGSPAGSPLANSFSSRP